MKQFPQQPPTCNIHFENIYVEQAVNLVKLRPTQGNALINVTFKNIHAPVANGIIEGLNARECVDGVIFDNLVIAGKPVRDLKETQIKVGSFVKNLKTTAP